MSFDSEVLNYEKEGFDMKVIFRIICLLVLMVMVCSCKHSMEESDQGNERKVLFECDSMARDEFLKFVDESALLNDEDKRVIKEKVDCSAGSYTHLSVIKYEEDGLTSMKIDSHYPRVETKGKNGKIYVEGGSGSVIEYSLVNGKWEVRTIMHYD